MLHNDWGLARILADGRFGLGAPDERYGVQLLAQLKQYPQARVVLAHLGAGKWTSTPVEHLRLIEKILADPAYDHVSFDISWNEVARHLQAEPEITDAFLDLVRAHSTRILFGSDAVKPVSNAQYFRHAHDLEPIFDRILDEIGPDAYHNVRHDNLERLLAVARANVQRWAHVQWTSGLWDEFLTTLDVDRQALIRRWLVRYELTVGAPTAEQRQGIALVDPRQILDPADPSTQQAWSDPSTQQAWSLVMWTAAVSRQATAGRLITVKLIASSIKAKRISWKAVAPVRADRAAAEKAEQKGLALATDAAGIGLVDEDGNPYTTEALIAGHRSSLATANVDEATRITELVQVTELAQRADNLAIAKERRRVLGWTVVAAVTTGVVLAAGTVSLWPLASVAGAWAWVARASLNLHRSIYVT
ncbi:MAG: hypothetical protein ACRD0H_10625, partial [Actinomycetes bacterium]